MVDRIQLILKVHNLTASRFADEIGVQRSSISHILSGRNMPSLDFVQKILRRYTEISPDWLLSGAGSMNRDGVNDLFTETKPLIQEKCNIDAVHSGIVGKDEHKELEMSTKVNMVGTTEPDEAHATPGEIEKEPGKMADVPLIQEKRTDQPVAGQRQIEKIVIFYTHQRFREYFPE